jgi:zinc protease
MNTIASRATELSLPNGGRAVILPTSVKDVVTIQGSIIGGPSAFAANESAAAEMAADLLDAGAGKLGKEAFRAALAARGAEIHFDTRDTRLTWSASCFPEDAPFVIARIADAIFSPQLLPAEFAAEKVRMISDLDDEAGNTGAQAAQALTRLLYAPSHPNYASSTAEEKKRAEAAAVADAKTIARQYGTKHLALAIVGDVNAKRLREAVEKAFGKAPEGKARPSAAPSARSDAKRENVIIPDKANADVSMGSALGFGMDDKRYRPTAVITYMLGGSFAGHLMQTVRERDGLTYGVRASLKGLTDKLDGFLEVWGTFAPQLLIRGTDTLERETRIFLKSGVTEESLTAVKDEIAGSYAVSLATTSGLARHIVRFIEDEKPVSWVDEYPDLVRAVSLKEAQDAAARLESLPLSIATAGSI